MNVLLTMVTDGKKQEHKLDSLNVAKEYAIEKMREDNLFRYVFEAKIYREGPPKELLTIVTNRDMP